MSRTTRKPQAHLLFRIAAYGRYGAYGPRFVSAHRRLEDALRKVAIDQHNQRGQGRAVDRWQVLSAVPEGRTEREGNYEATFVDEHGRYTGYAIELAAEVGRLVL